MPVATPAASPAAPVVPAADITLELFEADNVTKVADLTHSFARQFQTRLGEPGVGRFSVPVDVPSEWGAVTSGRVVRASVGGTPAFAFTPRSRAKRLIPAGDGARTVDFEGPGLLQSTLDGAVVKLRPSTTTFAGGVDKRLFGWQCPEFDDSAWATIAIGAPTYDPAPPLAWPDPFSNRCWMSGAGDGSTILARRNFTLASQMVLCIFVAADDGARVWLDGVPLGETDMPPASSLDRTWRWMPLVSAGPHTLAVEAIDGGGGGRWFSCSVYGVASVATGKLNVDSFLFHTGYQPGGEVVDPWKVFHFTGANRPGLSAGSILGILLGEGVVRGAISSDISWDFGAVVDSAANVWPTLPDTVLDVGRTYAEVVAQLSATDADIWMPPTGLTVHAVRWRERGNFHTTPAGVKLTGAFYGVDGARKVNLTELTWTDDLRPSSVTIVDRHRDGYGAAGSGPERFIDLGDVDASTGAGIAAAMSAARADAVAEVALTTHTANGDDQPFGDYALGDAVAVPTGAPGSETSTLVRVVGITVEDSAENHHLSTTRLEVVSALAEWQSTAQRQIDRLRAGVKTDSISAPETLGSGVKGGVVEETRMYFQAADSATLLADVIPTSLPTSFPTARSRMFRFVARLSTADVAAVEANVEIDGAAVHTITIPAATTKLEGFMGDIVGVWPSESTVTITDPGSVAAGLAIEIYVAPAL